ncbi:MAG: hypothetical protein Q8Q25_02215 [bacterium]|nr:hypothetical protein [bacterium]
MAGPIAHIFCALSVLNSGALTVTDKKAFIVGTSFPNIRYLGDIKNELSHKRKITWDTVQNEPSSFKAGMLFHVLVDEARENYFIEKGMYEKVTKRKNLEPAIKLYEDIILYDWVTDWQSIVRYFDTVLEQEQQHAFSNDRVMLFHTFLQRYLSMQPTREYVSNLVITSHPTFDTMLPLFKPFSVYVFKYYVNTLMDMLEQTPEVKDIITSFYAECVDNIVQ